MKRLLICGGIDGSKEALAWLKEAIAQRKPHAVLFTGGICSQAMADQDPEDLTPGQAEMFDKFFHTLGETGVYTALVPGWHDTPVEDFLQVAHNAEVDFSNVHCVHGTLTEEKDVALCGVGGELAETGSCKTGHWRRSRKSAEYYLRRLWACDKPRKFLLLGSPPTGKLGGQAGSPVVTELIDSYHPELCAVLGPTESRGWERVAHTFVVNPGRLVDGSAAWFDWTRPVEERVEMLDLTKEAPTRA